MSLLGIAAIALAVICFAGFLLKIIFKAKFFLFILLGTAVVLLATCIVLPLWGAKMYESGDVSLARWTFLVGGLLFATIILAPFVKAIKILTFIDMIAFLGFGLAFIILAVSLSKSELQPNAEIALLQLF